MINDDDIVARLYEIADEVDSTVPFHLNEAAGEIERLRKERDELAWAIGWFLMGGSRDKLEKRYRAFQENRDV